MVNEYEEDKGSEQDEYQYSDPDSNEAPAEQSMHQTLAHSMQGERRKRIIFIVVVFGLLFFIFQIIKVKDKVRVPAPASSLEKGMTAQPAAPAQPAANVSPAPGQLVITAPPGQLATTTASPTPPATIGQVTLPAQMTVAPSNPNAVASNLTEQYEKNTAQIQQIQTTLGNLEASVSHLAESMNVLQGQVKDLLKKQANVSARKKVKRASPKEKAYRISMHKPHVYYVQAIVPRRAWLQANDGSVQTVALGDKLEGYGEVRDINPQEGTVITSSNKIIRFSSND